MRRGRSSRTATWVAVWRGLGAFDLPAVATDPHAHALVPPLYRGLLDAAARMPRATRAAVRAAVVLSGGMARHLPFRTRAIDDLVTEELARGTAQLVLLGAGLDARAHRLPGLEHTRIFEVDHPATQAVKRAAAASLSTSAGGVVYVAVDFATDDLVEALSAAGFERARPCVIVWEGVTMYLSRAAIDATLTALAALASPGSVLVATYLTAPGPVFAMLGALASPFFVGIGEPLETRLAPAAAAALVAGHGFEPETDEGDTDWSVRWVGRRTRLVLPERLLAARRRAT